MNVYTKIENDIIIFILSEIYIREQVYKRICKRGSDTNESQRRKTRKCTAETDVFLWRFLLAAQLINVLYNIVGKFYIGHIPGYGDVALTGVGVTFPILTMISAFSAFAGMGGAPLASIQRKKNKQGAE